jgi:hypothetical protein
VSRRIEFPTREEADKFRENMKKEAGVYGAYLRPNKDGTVTAIVLQRFDDDADRALAREET